LTEGCHCSQSARHPHRKASDVCPGCASTPARVAGFFRRARSTCRVPLLPGAGDSADATNMAEDVLHGEPAILEMRHIADRQQTWATRTAWGMRVPVQRRCSPVSVLFQKRLTVGLQLVDAQTTKGSRSGKPKSPKIQTPRANRIVRASAAPASGGSANCRS